MTVRFGIIGVGNIGSAHAKTLYENKVEGAVLTALCDIDPQKREWAKQVFPGVEIFGTAEEFFEKSDVQAVILSVPHYFHPPYAILGFQKGMHVLTEKPAGVQGSAVEAMNRAAEESGKIFGIMFNQRTDPLYGEIRRMVQDGELGTPLRLLWEVTTWYRTQEYYDSGSWRATWTGEGGGVLMNQAPHQLDLLQWMFGMPQSVRAVCNVGKYHDIEVEDEATLYLTYENGATALFHTSTGEEQGVNRLEIVGTKKRIVAEGRQLTVYEKKNVLSQRVYEDRGSQHVGILQNFTDAIRKGTPLIAPGEEGIREASLCNAAYLSAWTDQTAALPVDTARFDRLLEERKQNSHCKDKTGKTPSGEYIDRWKNA